MPKYKIAELTVEMDPKHPTLLRQGEPYRFDFEGDADVVVDFSEEFLAQKIKEHPELTPDVCEYLWLGFGFYRKLVQYDGLMLHASALAYKGRAYLFSAPCGTGKSTHTSLWRKTFGEDVVILNDDKPALRRIDGVYHAFGTPFSGKTDQNVNMGVPLGGICILERSEENWIRRVSGKEVIFPIMHQTLRPPDEKNMDRLLANLDALLRTVPIYRMGCNISEDAARLACWTMHGGEQ